MAGEILGEGFVTIRPDMTAFTPELEAKIKGSLAAINTAGTQNPLQNAFAGSAAGAQQLEREVGAAATTIQQKAVPAVRTMDDVVKKSTKSVNEASSSVTGLQRSILSLTKLAPVLAAAFSVKLFSDFEKASEEAKAVFGDSAGGIIDFANGIDTSFRLTATAALRFAVDFGNALQGIGFSAKTAGDAAESLTTRTADVAAALAKTPQQIATAFNLALEGNTRGLKQLGITITAVDLQNRALQLGYRGTVAELSDAQRAHILYSLVLEKTAKFQGQAANTADTFAGKLGIFKATVGDAALAIGRDLAPAVEALLGAFAPLAKLVSDIPGPFLAFAAAAGTAAIAMKALAGSALLDFFAGLGPILINAAQAVKVLAVEFVTLGEAGLSVGVAFEALGGPVTLLALALGAAAAIFTITKPKVDALTSSMGVFNDIVDKTGDTLRSAALADLAKELARPEIAAALKETGIGVGDFATAVLDGSDATQKMVNRLIELHGEGKITDDQFATLYDSVLNLSTQFGDASATSANLAAIEKQLGIEAGTTNVTLKEQSKAIDKLFTVTDQLAKANRTLTESTDAQTAAQQKVNDLRAEGGKAEIAEARTHLAEAKDSLTGALERQAIAQKKLNDLNAPATERELSDATDKVTEAEIKVARAIRARDEALKALNRSQGRAINLAGLSLDQLRTTLANARATLAAQRESAKNDPAILQENAVEAEIDLRKAKDDVTDAQKKLLDLQNKGKVATDDTIAAEHELTLANNAVTKAQDQVNERQGKLDSLLAGNTQNAKLLTAAVKELQTATDRVHDAQADISELTAKQKDDVHTILGDQQLITEELRQQIVAHAALFTSNPQLRQGFVENFLQTLGATSLFFAPGKPGGVEQRPIVPGSLSPEEIDMIFRALSGDPSKLRDLLKSLGITVPGFAEGGTITKPTLAWIGEKFRAESVIPWDNAGRVWDVLSRSLPHMPTVVRQRLEPVIPGNEARISRPTHINRPVTEIDYDRLGAAVAKALRESGAGNDVDIHVHPAPGMSEAQLVRRAKREMGRMLDG